MNSAPAPRPGIAVSPDARSSSLELHGCRVVMRRVEGPESDELFLNCQAPAGVTDRDGQAGAIYRAIHDALEAEGADYGAVVSETVFIRDVPATVEAVRTARRRVLGDAHRPATCEIGQPPLQPDAWLEVQLQAVLRSDSSPRPESFHARSPCRCAECTQVHGLRLQVGDEQHFRAGALCGWGADAVEQTRTMFGLAEDLLRRAGMGFGDVVRTWIYLRDIDRDYADLNRARRVFFETRGIDPVPASTGIGGAPVSDRHDLCLSLYAIKADRPLSRSVMSAPTLNEAMEYGADFVRGMRIGDANKIALHVSGTASIDEQGGTAHVGDFAAQADRMLLNIAALLEGQGAGFGDVVSAITYLKHPDDAERIRERLRAAGFAGFPHALVAAPICRPELECETEVLAVLPRAAAAASQGTRTRA